MTGTNDDAVTSGGRPVRARRWMPPIRSAAATVAALVLAGSGARPMAAAAVPARATQFGVYIGPGCAGRAAIPGFERFAGRRVERTVDALNQSSWKAMISSIDWTTRCWKGSGVKLTLSVPMLPFDRSGTLRDGVAGRFDPVFVQTARALVRDGAADAVVRIGWEMNGAWMPWTAARDPAAYIAYYRRIVGLMRAVPGQRFRFEWTPNIGTHDIAPERAYPGDDVVDVIGMDVYNEVWSPTLANPAIRFQWFKRQANGLMWHRAFAAAHGKPTAYSEWGTGSRADGKGGGDDPVFIRGMADWFAESAPFYQSYWEVRRGGTGSGLSSGAQPQAAAAYRQAFSRR